MKLLWLGDLGTTGFGTVTLEMCQRLVEQGVDLRIFQYREEAALVPPWAEGRMLTVEREDGWLTYEEAVQAQEIMKGRVRAILGEPQPDGWQPEVVVTLGDPASLIRSEMASLLPEGLPAWHYVPIEGFGLPPYWRLLWDRVRPIAMSAHGAREIARLLGGAEPPIVYHGVDTDTFHKADHANPIVWPDGRLIESRVDAKKAFGIDPKTTLLLRCDANMPRKAWGSLLRAMSPVLAKHHDALLFCHTPAIGEGGNMDEHRSHFVPHIAGRMIVSGFHEIGPLPRFALATLYNAADVYVSNSCEGFGLTIAEALACGTPAVGVDFSAVPEVIGPAGIVVPGVPVENIYSHWWVVAQEGPFAAATDHLISEKKARWTAAGLGPQHIRRHFQWATEAEKLVRILGADVAPPTEVEHDAAEYVATDSRV